MSKIRTNRSASRLAAVQALYEYTFGGKTLDDIGREFLTGNVGGELIEEINEFGDERFVPVMPAEPELFSGILACYGEKAKQIDDLIDAALSEEWDRLEITLRALLRAGVAELIAFPATPVPIVITEYLDLATAFYGNGVEVRLTNGVLDKIAKQVR